jgi:hypothetical protein
LLRFLEKLFYARTRLEDFAKVACGVEDAKDQDGLGVWVVDDQVWVKRIITPW